MTRFLDTHKIGSLTEGQIIQMQQSTRDEFGVAVLNMLYNFEADIMYCILDAPSQEAVKMHHAKMGYIYDSIIEIKTTA